jgi:hypothetical protein
LPGSLTQFADACIALAKDEPRDAGKQADIPRPINRLSGPLESDREALESLL